MPHMAQTSWPLGTRFRITHLSSHATLLQLPPRRCWWFGKELLAYNPQVLLLFSLGSLQKARVMSCNWPPSKNSAWWGEACGFLGLPVADSLRSYTMCQDTGTKLIKTRFLPRTSSNYEDVKINTNLCIVLHTQINTKINTHPKLGDPNTFPIYLPA